MNKYNGLSILLALVTGIAPSFCTAGDKKIIGWIEDVIVMPGDIKFSAKLDTGALTSSINAKNITEFERDGNLWVRFEIINNDHESRVIELPQLRTVKIKRHYKKSQERHVVKLGLCLDNKYKETEVSLVDRDGFIYKLLIGRRFIKGDFVVDPSEHHITLPNCGMEVSD